MENERMTKKIRGDLFFAFFVERKFFFIEF